METTTWPSEWLRGVLSMCVLAAVADQPDGTHGYAIGRRLADGGLGRIKGGTLYPVLARLEADGLVTSTWAAGAGGPGRKIFLITDTGRASLAERRERWREFTSVAAGLIDDRDRSTS